MVPEGEEQSVTLELLRQKMADFAKERDWGQYHSPRNLLLALVLYHTQSLFFVHIENSSKRLHLAERTDLFVSPL